MDIGLERLRLRRQWIVQASGQTCHDGWSVLKLSKQKSLYCHPDLSVCSVELESKQFFLLGIGVNPNDGNETYWFDRLAEDSDIPSILEDVEGVYVFLECSGEKIKLYTDPAGMMGVYYRPGIAASSPSLLPNLQRDEEVDRQYQLGGTDDWYTGSRCPFTNIKYLLANHYLDIETGEIERFWPLKNFDELSFEDGVAQCSDLMRNAVGQYVRRGDVLLSLTGGKDSRVNLAAAKSFLDQITVFTLRSPQIKLCDVEAPRLMSDMLNFEHHIEDVPENDKGLVELYDEISGNLALGARRDILAACKAFEGKDAIHLSGNLGAITKSYFWPNKSPASVNLDALLKEFVQKPQVLVDGAEEWLESVPNHLAPHVVYNLMYLEQRGGRWMGVGENASSLFYQPASLFCSRKIFETVCSMPLATQYGGTLLEDFANYMCPELNSVPYCKNTRNLSSFIPRSIKNKLKTILHK